MATVAMIVSWSHGNLFFVIAGVLMGVGLEWAKITLWFTGKGRDRFLALLFVAITVFAIAFSSFNLIEGVKAASTDGQLTRVKDTAEYQAAVVALQGAQKTEDTLRQRLADLGPDYVSAGLKLNDALKEATQTVGTQAAKVSTLEKAAKQGSPEDAGTTDFIQFLAGLLGGRLTAGWIEIGFCTFLGIASEVAALVLTGKVGTGNNPGPGAVGGISVSLFRRGPAVRKDAAQNEILPVPAQNPGLDSIPDREIVQPLETVQRPIVRNPAPIRSREEHKGPGRPRVELPFFEPEDLLKPDGRWLGSPSVSEKYRVGRRQADQMLEIAKSKLGANR